jgi:putative colanic acid biosynthesis UDP-glucose lipid carrier transferase
MGTVGTDGLIRSHMRHLIMLLRVFDASLIGGALFAATWVTGDHWTPTHTAAAFVAMGLFTIFGEANLIYGSWRGSPMKLELLRGWTTYLLCLPGLALAGYFSRAYENIGNVTAALWLVFAPLALVGARALLRLSLQEARARGRNTRQVAFVGATEAAYRVRRAIEEAPWYGFRVHGFYDDRHGSSEGGEETALAGGGEREESRLVHTRELGKFRGGFEQLIADARAGKIDVVYIALPLRAELRIRQVVAALADTTAQVHVVADVLLTTLMESHFSSVGELPVIDVFDHPFHGVDGTLKRVEDIVLGGIILAIIALPMALIALAIKLTSKGPILFKQRRYGLNGQEIRVLKFRSMTVAEDGDEIRQAKRGDARITRLGAFLRRTSLDELPQFLQVITGEMSIVGPRPHAIAHNEQYRRLIPGYMLRHKVKPGITGWAQVNGWRGETDTLEKMEKRVEHDLFYLAHWALPFDLRIIFLTVVGSAARRNAF